MGKIALVFPGQGTQYVGMCRELYLAHKSVRDLFAEAADILALDLARLCFEGPREILDLTENTQLAVLVCNLAIYRLFSQELSVKVELMAGHSVGEYAALTAAGIIDFPDVFPLVRARAKYHQEAMPVGEGGMAAILGLSPAEVFALCAAASEAGGKVFVSILNAPGQVVVSGNIQGLERLMALAATKSGVKAIKLPISVPCHCELLAGAAEALKVDLGAVTFHDGHCPVIPNCAPELFYKRDLASALLLRQMTQPVRWQETVEKMASLGVETIVELGPKRTLINLIKRIDPGFRLLFVEDNSSWHKVSDFVHG